MLVQSQGGFTVHPIRKNLLPESNRGIDTKPSMINAPLDEGSKLFVKTIRNNFGTLTSAQVPIVSLPNIQLSSNGNTLQKLVRL
jgi:hypothetical protein